MKKILVDLAALALSIWILAEVLMNPAAASAISIRSFFALIAFATGMAIYDATKKNKE